jgi:O-antigen/teichoic acid export membrane protein
MTPRRTEVCDRSAQYPDSSSVGGVLIGWVSQSWRGTGPIIARVLRLALGPAGVYLAASIIAKAGALVLIPLYTRKLSPDQYGDLVLAQALVSILPTLLSWGLASAVGRAYFDGPDREAGRRQVGGVARWLAIVTLANGVVVQAVLALVVPAGGHGITGNWELTCILWAAVGSALADVPLIFLRAEQRPYAAAGLQLGQFFTAVLGGLVLVAWLGRGLRGAIEGLALTSLMGGAFGLLFILGALRGAMTPALFREAVRFSAPFIPHFIANQLQAVGDRWVLKASGLQGSLGAYGLANQLVQPAAMVVGAWNMSASPQMGEVYRDGGVVGLVGAFGRALTSYLMAAIFPAMGVVLLLPAVAWVVGDHYSQSLWIVPLLAASIVIEALYYPCVNVLFYCKSTKAIPVITASAGLLNLGLNVVAIPWFGVSGAIASRLISVGYRSGATWLASRGCLAEAP